MQVQLDDRTDTSFGRRVTDWELKGVPLRVEVGPRDLANEQVTLVRRDSGAKTQVPLAGLSEAVTDALEQAQVDLLAAATEERDARTVDVAHPRRGPRGRPDRVRPPALGARRRRRRGRSSRRRRSPCAASSARTARCPRREDEADLVALVARSY